MTSKIKEWEKPKKHVPIVNEIADISSRALSQLTQYLQQFPPSIPGRAVDGASPVDISQDGEYIATVSNINFITPDPVEQPNASTFTIVPQSDGGTAAGVGGSGGGLVGTGGAGGAVDIHTSAATSASVSSILTGSGTPEGAVVAPVGTLFLRTDGGASTTLYVKESGSGNTGWVGK